MLLPLSKDKEFPDLDAVPTVFSYSQCIYFEFAPSAISVPVQAELSVGDCVSALQRIYLLLFGFCS